MTWDGETGTGAAAVRLEQLFLDDVRGPARLTPGAPQRVLSICDAPLAPLGLRVLLPNTPLPRDLAAAPIRGEGRLVLFFT